MKPDIENASTVQLGDKLYTVGVNSTTVQYNTQCKDCGDTGWIVSYGPGTAGKYLCDCPKGIEKSKMIPQQTNISIELKNLVTVNKEHNSKKTEEMSALPEVKGRKFR